MSTPGRAAREPMSGAEHWGSIVPVWLAAAVASALVVIFAPIGHVAGWFFLVLGGCGVATLCLQLATRRIDGVVGRATASLTGALIVLALATGVLGLVALAR